MVHSFLLRYAFPLFAFSAFFLSFILKKLGEVGQGFDAKDLVWPSFAEG